jgi:hypothetical protein
MHSARFKLRTRSIALGDDGDLRWVSLIPEGPIFAHGMEWRFDADSTDPDLLRFTFDDAVESLERWLGDFAPAIAIEHTKDGTAAGYLRRIRVLTRAEAAAHGLSQASPRMIYGGLDITSPKWAEAFDAGEVPYVSPNIRAWASTERESAPAYPFAIGEVSFVTIPQVKAQQIPVADMRGVSLSEGNTMMMTSAECAAYCVEQGMEQTAIDELIGKLFGAAHEEAHKAMEMETVAAEDPEAIEAAAVAELERAAEMEKAEDELDKADEAMLADEVKRLRTALLAEKRARAAFAVKSSLGNRNVSPATEALLRDAYLAGGGKFEALLKDLGHTPRPAAPAARPVPRAVAPIGPNVRSASLAECIADGKRFDALTDDQQWERICELSDKEGIAHWQAASWIRFGRTPDSVLELRNARTR